MSKEINQSNEQDFEFDFGDLDSLQEQVALRKNKKNLNQQTQTANSEVLDYEQPREKTQEEIDLEYSLAKIKQDLDFNSQNQEEQQEVNLTYPAQKREFLNETLEVVDKGITPNIKESLDILDKLDEVEEQIAKKEKELNALNTNTEQEKDSSSPSKTILNSEIDETLKEQQQEQIEKHQKELEFLQKEREAQIRNFKASIENLIKQGDIKDLFKNLQTLDESFAKSLKKTKEDCNLIAKQRIEKLELAMQSKNVKEAVSGFVKELHTNRKEVKGQLEELNLQHECYQFLDKLQKNASKSDEKAKTELENEIKALEEKHPTFKENYPKFYEKLSLKEPQKQQENSRTKQRSV